MSVIKTDSLKVLGLRVAIQRQEKEKSTEGGILLPNSSGDKPMLGKVVAVGCGEKSKDGQMVTVDQIKKGDTVLFQKWGGTEIKTDSGEVVIMNVSDILAIV